jgi:HD-GYP domain-containing protein (c-di-GMP phosphodiesterase class II)
MSSSTRFAIWALVLATAVCAALAAFTRSEVFAILAAGCATFAVVVGFSTTMELTTEPVAALQTGYDPTTSATVDVLDLPRPVVFESTDISGDVVPLHADQPKSLYEAAGRLGHLPQVWPAPLFTPKMPVGSEPRDVVASLLVAGRAAGHPVAAHLWLEDATTDTLRLVEAQGEAPPDSIPVSLAAGLLGAALAEGTAQLGPVECASIGTPHVHRWRYALPLSASDPRGVAGLDFEGDAEPDRAVLTSISASLRASLSGALALHVAHLEADTARVLVDTCAELSRILDPDDVLHSALNRAMELGCAQTGSIMLLDPTTRRMRIAVARGLPDEIVESTDIPEGDGIAGWVLASRQPLVIEDLKSAGIRSRRHGIRSAVCVPLADEQGIVGVLNVGCTSFQARVSRSHLDTLEALGRTVVVALRNAWASEGAQDLYFDTLKALAIALEARDPYSRGGTARIVELVEALADSFALDVADANALRIAAMLHDVGMSAAGTSAPLTDGPLSTVEWGMLKMHPVIAAEILSQAPALSAVTPIVYHHHEHFDGTGYVAGLVGSQIPLGARILAVADAYVAMTSPRAYRPALSRSQAMGEMRRLAGSQFDPRVVSALGDVVERVGRDISAELAVSPERTTAAP